MTFVNTIEGPQKTSSSSSTPSYTDTLFWILQLSPILVPFMTTTFCPRLHRAPITAPGITWQKCQIFVPSPIVAPSATYADSCTNALFETLIYTMAFGVSWLCHSCSERTRAALDRSARIASEAAL